MTRKNELVRSFAKFRREKKSNKIFSTLRAFMPEIVYRTTKLEGEKATRRSISALF